MKLSSASRAVAVGVSCAALGAMFAGGAAQAITDTVFKYSPAKSGYVMVPPAAFIPRNNTLQYDIVNFLGNIQNGVNTCFAAPVSLPHGAKVTALAVWRRSGAATMTIELDRVNITTGGLVEALLSKTLPDTSFTMQAKNYLVSTTIDNTHYTYTAYLCLSNSNDLFGGMRIGFTYDNAGY